MASPAAYEGGGIGGKFRKRPFRRAAATTPYDRPPSALRGARSAAAGGPGGGWLSRLVAPTSRIIASSASKLFSSVFRKRLPPALPAATPEASLQSSEEVPEVVVNNSQARVEEHGGSAGEKLIDETDVISNLEQLLKQKTFTRVEFDHLTELLRSRTVESGSSEPATSDKDKEHADVSLQENGTGSSRLYGNISTRAGRLSISGEEAASPAEIAKAFMGSRPSKVSPSSLALRSQVLQEETILHSNLPQSIVRFSEIPEPSKNGYLTPRAQGRSAIYKMSRSPYFKVQPTSNIKAIVPALHGHTGPSTLSQQTPTTVARSDGQQVLKRRSSVLESDIGSFGPIRRIRQRSNLMSPMKDLRSSLSRNHLLPSLPTPLSKDGIPGSASLIQTILPFDVQDAGNEDNKASCSTIAPIPPQSSEMARKILQQLDKLVPSPKEKSSEMKAISRNETPSKLTVDMLHGWALRSMEDIDSSKFLDAQGSENIEANSDSHLPNISLKQDKVEENGHLKAALTGVNMKSEAGGRENAITYGQASRSAMMTSSSQVVPPRKKPAFKISALEDSLEMDDDDSNVKDVSGPSTSVKDKLESEISGSKSVISETISEKAQVHSSQSVLGSIPKSQEVVSKATDGLVPAEKAGFSFPVVQDSNYFLPPPTPTMPISDKSAQQQEQPAAPVFSFGSKDAPTLKFPSTVTSASDSGNLKFGKSKLLTVTSLDSLNSNSNKGERVQKALDIPKSMGDMVSSGTLTSTMSPVLAFGTPIASTMCNGSLGSTSSALSVSTAPFTMSSDAPLGMAFSSSTIAATSSSSISISSSAPIFSTITTFQFGSGSSTSASMPVEPTLDKSGSKELEKNPVKALPLSFTSAVGTSVVASTGSSSSPVLTTSYAFSSTSSASSGMTTASVLSSLASASSSVTTSSLSSSSINGSSAPTASSLFSSMGGGSSALAKSTLFTSTGCGSSNPATPLLSSGSSSSSSFSCAGTGISAFGVSTPSNSSSLSFGNNTTETATAFGATAGSIFGTQATPSGSGMSSFSQSTGQIDSFSSSPTFGLSSSSPFVFGSSPFGSSAPSAKSTSTSSVFSITSGAGSSSSTSGSSFAAAAVPNLFSSNSQPSTSSVFGSTFGSSTSPSTVFSFGSSAPSGSSPLAFGSSSSLTFPFTSLGPPISSFSPPASSMFGMPTPATGFSSGSQGNDQMNVEDSMADDTISSPFTFSSQAQPAFQFGSHQNSSLSQNPSPFQAGGNLEFTPGGSFSLGSGGADKSGRKIVKVRRDKHRKK